MVKNVICTKLHIVDFVVQKQISKSGYDLFFICNAFYILDIVKLTLIIYDKQEFHEAGNT
jgi:hypothetical protein